MNNNENLFKKNIATQEMLERLICYECKCEFYFPKYVQMSVLDSFMSS